ncbi:MAG: DNA topoisomerase IB [Acidobacteriota bacterium]
MTQLERLQQSGIKRLGTKKRFRYIAADGGNVSRADLARIEALKIPPAWTDVAINRAAGGMLQALGKDAAGRWQYIYHDQHIKKRERKKFNRLLVFAEAVPKMRRAVSRNLRKRDLGRERVMACIMRILGTCFMRAGSQVYVNENGSYGLATLRPKHVSVRGDVIEFNFPGKSKVIQHRELRDRAVARVVRELLKLPAPEVFKYQNEDGGLVDVRRRNINGYIKEVMGERFTSKDFRTWAGTLICACALARAGAEVKETAPSRKRKVIKAIKETAEVLGNTPAVCRSAYICPEVLNRFDRGEVIDQYFESLEDLIGHRGKQLHKAEKALLRLLKNKSK